MTDTVLRLWLIGVSCRLVCQSGKAIRMRTWRPGLCANVCMRESVCSTLLQTSQTSYPSPRNKNNIIARHEFHTSHWIITSTVFASPCSLCVPSSPPLPTFLSRCGADGHWLADRKLLLCGRRGWQDLRVWQEWADMCYPPGSGAVQPQRHRSGPHHGVSVVTFLKYGGKDITQTLSSNCIVSSIAVIQL